MTTTTQTDGAFRIAAMTLWILATLPVALAAENAGSKPASENERGMPDRIIKPRRVIALQSEPEDKETGRYDWGPSVMRDGHLYRMWWVRQGGGGSKRFAYRATLPDGEVFEFTYPDYGDRIYYAESRDGLTWPGIAGDDFAGRPEEYDPDANGPLMVLRPAESRHQIHHVGRPSVIKVEGVFYMYYEAPSDYRVTRGPDGQPKVGEEYGNAVFLATSPDGKRWLHWPDDTDPQPLLKPPADGPTKYGYGQPSVCYRDGRFVLHYVNSHSGPGDFMIRIESMEPFFKQAKTWPRSLTPATQPAGAPAGRSTSVPAGAVARFAQTDVRYLGDVFYLVRPAYGTGNLGVLATRDGVFHADADAHLPAQVFPQIAVRDPRGQNYRERLFPAFLTDPHGRILVEEGHAVLFYSSGRGFKEHAYTWDLQRCEVDVEILQTMAR